MQKLPWKSRLAIHAVLIALAVLFTRPALAVLSCSASATPVTFGLYSPASAADLDSTGNVQVSCDGGRGLVSIQLSAGSSGDANDRRMFSGADSLRYNLYDKASRNQVWGDGTGGTQTVICVHGWTSCFSRKSASTQVKEISLSMQARMPYSMPAMVIGDRGPGDPEEIRRVVFCSGKVYYDLAEKRDAENVREVAVMRAEQLYPFPEEELRGFVNEFPNATEVVWCQEEPKNMGYWAFIEPYLEWVLDHIKSKHKRPRYAGRPAAASPASRAQRGEVSSSVDDSASANARWARSSGEQ